MPEYQIIAANELADAVAAGLISQEEARLIYWAQFPSLRQQAATTPPVIGGDDA